MATSKKAKGTKGKAKRKRKKKTPVTRATTRRKTKTVSKKPAKKAPRQRTSPKKAKPSPRTAAKPIPARPPAEPIAGPPAQPAPSEERIGVVTHYYSHLLVATVRLESATLRVGDVIHIRGHTTDFNQRVGSLEVNHAPVTEVGPNDDFGLKVVEHAREHDVVYKLRQ